MAGDSGGSEDALNRSLALLKAKDDTSRFVGLSLLRSVLDADAGLRTDSETITRCWRAISSKFLVRLLRSTATEKRSDEEAKSMVELAVAVIHIFANLLPPQALEDECMAGFCDTLLQCIPRIGPASMAIALQTSQVLAGTQHGAGRLLAHQDPPWVSSLIEVAADYPREVGRVLRAARIASSAPSLQSQWNAIFTQFLNKSEGVDRQNLIEILAEVLSDAQLQGTPEWLPRTIDIVQQALLSQPTPRVRQASISLAASLLQHSDGSSSISHLLFGTHKPKDASKSFAYFFTNLVSIEIRSAIPSLMEKLTTPNYTRTALHLGSCFDILSNFIIYLLQSMDDSDIVEGQRDQMGEELLLPPDQLLKLRSGLTETFSLTLEYLRDRWDAAVTGARGLDPSTYGLKRPPEVANAPRALTWDNPTVSPEDDPIFLASFRALAIWLRDDDNPKLQEQALTNMDMMLALYGASNGRGDGRQTPADFRQPVLMLLYALLSASEAAVHQFLEHDGWALLAEDLEKCSSETGPVQQPYTQEIIRCLLAVTESTFVPQSREGWMSLVALFAKLWPVSLSNAQLLEDVVAGFQLAVALVLKAPKRLQKQYRQEWQAIHKRAELLLLTSQNRAEGVSAGVRDGLMEVVAGLDGMQEAQSGT